MGLRKIFSMLVMNKRGMSIAVGKKRQSLSKELSERMKHTIKYGPFASMKFTQDNWWGGLTEVQCFLVFMKRKF
jgi:hypothetical protein